MVKWQSQDLNPELCDPKAHVFPSPGGVFRSPFVYLVSVLNPDVKATSFCCPHCSLLSAWPWQKGRSDSALTDALEIGSGPVGDVHSLVKHALGQAGGPGFTLEARVTNIPLPGVEVVTLDPDVCMFHRCGSWACDACRSADEREEMKRFQLAPREHGW